MTSVVATCNPLDNAFPLWQKTTGRNFDRMRLALLPLRLRSFGVDDLADVIAREPGRVDDVDLPGALRGLGADRLVEDGTALIGSFLGAMVRAGDALQLVDAFLLGAVHGHSMPHRYAYTKALNEADAVCPCKSRQGLHTMSASINQNSRGGRSGKA